MQEITNIRQASQDELKSFFKEIDEKAFRIKQLNQWIWTKGVNSFQDMNNLSKKLISLLEQRYYFNKTKLISNLISEDKSEKFCFDFFDNNKAEAVLIINDDGRTTACISTQSGCPLNCKFCATAKYGFRRNLLCEEIYDQVAFLNNVSITKYNRKLSNIVFMGMGEPFLNYENLINAIDIITNTEYLAFCPSRLTISTVGIPDKIKALADYNSKINLALSLHETSDSNRDKIIPINNKYNIATLINALKYYYSKSKNLNTLEYILFQNVNDTPDKAEQLADIAFKSHSKINIIQFNEVENIPFKRVTSKNLKSFTDVLLKRQVVFTIRYSKGNDINAACGQLASIIDNK